MVATERQARDDDLSTPGGDNRVGRQRVAHDAIVDLRVKAILVESDSRTTGTALRSCGAEAPQDLGASVSILILERDEESSFGNLATREGVVVTAPSVDVNDAVGRDDQMPGVSDVVGKHGGTEPRG